MCNVHSVTLLQLSRQHHLPELRALVVLELEWFSSSESDSNVLTDNFLGMG